jgi:hypothetical protein
MKGKKGFQAGEDNPSRIWVWNKGTKGVMKANIGSFKKGEMRNEKHPNWKGDKASYFAIHTWVKRNFASQDNCEECGTTNAKRIEWANLSGLYKRVRSDWKRLCSPCHHKMDRIAERGWETRKKTI